MPRSKRTPKKKKKVIEDDDSDIEEQDTPDPESEEFFYDDVDKFHSNREKILLQKSSHSSDEDSEGFEQVEEVLGLDIESDDGEEEDNDEDDIDDDNKIGDALPIDEDGLLSSDEDIEKGIPSDKAWGKKKNVYYDAEQHKEKDLDSEEEEALDKEEEEEVLMLQRNLAARLDENDFDIEEFELANDEGREKQKSKAVQEAQQEKIIMDLSKLSKEEKIKLLGKDSPELFELMNDLKEKLSEVTDRLYPLVQMARSGKITNPQGVEYLEMKHQLIMNYLINVYFYLLLKANQTPVKNHPVIARLVQYRELLQQLEPLDVQLHDEIEYFLSKYKENDTDETPNGTSNEHVTNNVQKKTGSKKKVKFPNSKSSSAKEKVQSDHILSSGSGGKKRKKLEDLDPLSYYEAIRDMKKKKKEERKRAHATSIQADLDNTDDEEDADGKRGITYQISKNKGLTPKRKKEVRNPRLKHRKKFVKAKIKRKSQVNPVVKELSRYGGESTGIKTHLTRSVKIK